MIDPRKRTTAFVERLDAGEASAAEDLLPIVYDQLRRLAARYLDRGPSGHVLQPTALVHEAYLKLIENPDRKWNGRQHFAAVAAKAMRQVLLDHLKARGRDKRSGSWEKVTLSHVSERSRPAVGLLELEEAFQELSEMNKRMCQVAELRVLGGLSCNEISELMGLGVSTVEADWTMAKACLRRALHRPEE